MDDGTLRATFVLMDTYTADGTFEEVEKATKSKIREAYGFIDNEIIRILPYEEAVQKPLSLEDVLKVEEPLRGWPSPAAISAHRKRGGRWLYEEKTQFWWLSSPVIKIGVFYENNIFMEHTKATATTARFGPVDENYNRVPWPKDEEGNLL